MMIITWCHKMRKKSSVRATFLSPNVILKGHFVKRYNNLI